MVFVFRFKNKVIYQLQRIDVTRDLTFHLENTPLFLFYFEICTYILHFDYFYTICIYTINLLKFYRKVPPVFFFLFLFMVELLSSTYVQIFSFFRLHGKLMKYFRVFQPNDHARLNQTTQSPKEIRSTHFMPHFKLPSVHF